MVRSRKWGEFCLFLYLWTLPEQGSCVCELRATCTFCGCEASCSNSLLAWPSYPWRCCCFFEACPPDYEENGGSCYLLVTTPATGNAAQADCQADGGNLVTINDAAEDAFVADKFGYALCLGYSWCKKSNFILSLNLCMPLCIGLTLGERNFVLPSM